LTAEERDVTADEFANLAFKGVRRRLIDFAELLRLAPIRRRVFLRAGRLRSGFIRITAIGSDSRHDLLLLEAQSLRSTPPEGTIAACDFGGDAATQRQHRGLRNF
jgi:hypothetical protein